MTLDQRTRVQGRDQTSQSPFSGFIKLWGVALLATSIVWPRYGFLGIGPLKATPFTLLAVLSWAVLPLTLLLDRQLGGQFVRAVMRRRFIILAVFLWYFWRVFTTMLGEDVIGSMTFLLRQVIYFWPVLFLSLILCTGPNGRQRVVDLVVLSTAAVIVAAAMEYVSGQTVSRLMGLQFAGDANQLNTLAQSNTRAEGGAIRLQSVFYHPIVFAQYLAWVAPMMLHVATTRGRLVLRIIAGLCFLAAPFFILKTDARSGLLAFAFAMVMYGGLVFVKRAGLFSLPTLLAACAAIALALGSAQAGQSSISGLLEGRNATEASSSRTRSAMFERGLEEIRSSPIVGFGDNRAPLHAGVHGKFGVLTIDSAYLSSLLDSGWVGLGLMALAWLSALVAATRCALLRSGDSLDAAIAAGLAAIIIVFSVLSIMDNITLIFISIAMTLGTWSSSLGGGIAPVSAQRVTRNAPVRSGRVSEKR
jgi:hypothetical protein